MDHASTSALCRTLQVRDMSSSDSRSFRATCVGLDHRMTYVGDTMEEAVGRLVLGNLGALGLNLAVLRCEGNVVVPSGDFLTPLAQEAEREYQERNRSLFDRGTGSGDSGQCPNTPSPTTELPPDGPQ